MAWSPHFTDVALVVPRVMRLFNLHDSVAPNALVRTTATSALAPLSLGALSEHAAETHRQNLHPHPWFDNHILRGGCGTCVKLLLDLKAVPGEGFTQLGFSFLSVASECRSGGGRRNGKLAKELERS